MNGIYKVETHLHTSQGSACAHSTGAEMAQAYKAHGYDTIIITDHFFGGNTAVPENLPWEKRIELYCAGYNEAKTEGDKIGLCVLFGIEWAYHGTEFLTYGLEQDWLLRHPEMEEWDIVTYLLNVHKDGGFAVHAHPFRWSENPPLFPIYVDAVETYNAGNADKSNVLAKQFAASLRLPETAGSDEHDHRLFRGSGMAFETPIVTIQDFIRAVRTCQPFAVLQNGENPKNL